MTDTNYQLPKVIALTAQDILSSGTTQPVIIYGVNDVNNTSDYYVIKPKGSGRMSVAASMREFLASFIALELDLNVPLPAIIQVSKEFIESTRFTNNFPHFENSKGNNFGSQYVRGFITISEDKALFKKYFEDLQEILVFDIFISTSDRRKDKSNMAEFNSSIYIYDHELSFSFVHEIFPNSEPWKITLADKTSIEGHLLYNYFRGKEFKCDNFINRFTSINDNFWTKAFDLLPSDIVDEEQFEKIKYNLSLKVDNLNIYREEIKKVLL